MRIGVLAKRAGITASRIRFYETRGVLPPPIKTLSGYRDYDERAVRILLFVQRASALGFTLREIGAFIHSPVDKSRKRRLLAKLEQKVEELDTLLAQLQSRRSTLVSLIAETRAAHGL